MSLATLILSHNVYRRPTATNEKPASGHLPSGSVIGVMEVVFGKKIEGNEVWYRAEDGFYYWSGGVADETFVNPALRFENLTDAQQVSLCRQALAQVYPRYRVQFPELTGMAVNRKQTGKQFLDRYSLVFYVDEKKPTPRQRLPEGVIFKGYTIPTDVAEAQTASLCFIGEFVSKPDYDPFGTSGFLAMGNDAQPYLITNYHVLCEDRRLVGQLSLLENDPAYHDRRRVIDRTGTLAGQLADGVMGAFSDHVRVRLNAPFLSLQTLHSLNEVEGVGRLTGILKRNEILNFQPGQIQVQARGVTTGTITGTIHSLFARVEISAANHTFFNVIQLNALADRGDSGAPVWTHPERKLIGILVASDRASGFAYVIPISQVFKDLSLDFIL